MDRELTKISHVKRANTLVYKTDTEKQANSDKVPKGNKFVPFIVNYSSTFNQKHTFYDKFKILRSEFLTNNSDISQIFQGTIPQVI